MSRQRISFSIFIIFYLIVPGAGCKRSTYDSPQGYDLNKPRTISLKHNLDEISGLCFIPGNEQMVNAIEDEHGKLYSIDLNSGESSSYKFSNRGDYEDLAFYNNGFFILKSNGHITRFSLPVNGAEPSDVKVMDTLLPKAEYEGMAILNDSLFVLTKLDNSIDQRGRMKIYRFIISDTSLSAAGTIEPYITGSIKEGKNKPAKLHPSCLAKNPADNNWYVISSINKQLYILDEKFNLVSFYELDPRLFRQPEGLAFTSKGDMLVSNEANGGTATILYFNYSAK